MFNISNKKIKTLLKDVDQFKEVIELNLNSGIDIDYSVAILLQFTKEFGQQLIDLKSECKTTSPEINVLNKSAREIRDEIISSYIESPQLTVKDVYTLAELKKFIAIFYPDFAKLSSQEKRYRIIELSAFSSSNYRFKFIDKGFIRANHSGEILFINVDNTPRDKKYKILTPAQVLTLRNLLSKEERISFIGNELKELSKNLESVK